MQIDSIKLFGMFATEYNKATMAHMQYLNVDAAIKHAQPDKDRPPHEVFEMQEAALYHKSIAQNARATMDMLADLCEPFYKPYLAIYATVSATRYVKKHIAQTSPHLMPFVPNNQEAEIREIIGVNELAYDTAALVASTDLGFNVLTYDGPMANLFVDPDEKTIGEDAYALHLTVDALEKYALMNKGREVPTDRMIRGLKILIKQNGQTSTQRQFCLTVWGIYIAYIDALMATQAADSQEEFDKLVTVVEAYEQCLFLVVELTKSKSMEGFIAQYLHQRIQIRYSHKELNEHHYQLSGICEKINVDLSDAIEAGMSGVPKQIAEAHERGGGIFGIKDTYFKMVP